MIEWLGNGTTVEIPDNVSIIGKDVFANNTEIESVTIPASVTEIQEGAFSGCTSLTTVTFAENSNLRSIGKGAFQNDSKLDNLVLPASLETVEAYAFSGCGNLQHLTLPKLKSIGTDAFQDVPGYTEYVEPVEIITPTPEPTETPAPAPEKEIEINEVEWDEGTAGKSTGKTSGKTTGTTTTSTRRQTHGRSHTEMTHDYDQVRILLNEDGSSESMHTLTLDGETLPLSLSAEDGKEREFTLTLYDWTNPDAGLDERKAHGDTLILQAKPAQRTSTEEPDRVVWDLNGTVLRQLQKSGIDYLVFRQGEQMTAVPTEGFLAGWAYDEMRKRGLGGRSFQYRLTMAEEEEPRWTVEADGQEYELDSEPLAAIYLRDVVSGTTDILTTPREDTGT